MSFQSITLKNYRSYDSASFEFGPGVTIIIGPNASGKTNLLEAVYTLSVGGSFRVSDKDLINNESEWSRVEALVDEDERVLKIKRAVPRTQKTFTINGTEKSRLIYENVLPTVLFEPDDIRMISGSPERRREYLDTLISALSPTYKRALSSYRRALKQRNNLLKKRASRSHVFPWDVVMSRNAEILATERSEVIAKIQSKVQIVYNTLSDKNEAVLVQYEPSLSVNNYANNFIHKLEHLYVSDIEKGFTGIGPHRDDFSLSVNNTNAATHASRGECRTLTLALKVIEMLMIEDVRGIKPLLLLDDVFSELDGTRRRKLTEFLKDHQSIITTTDADVVDKKFARLAEFISL